MRLVNTEGRAALVVDGVVHDAESVGLPSDPMLAIGRLCDASLTELPPGGRPIAEVTLGPPVPRPRNVIGAGVNYRSHAREMGLEVPKEPLLFLRLSSAIIGPVDDVVLPPGRIDWEAELVVVIGRRGRGIAVEDAWRHVAGLTSGQDISHRDHQARGGEHMSFAKSYDTFAPIGPAIVTPDEFSNADDLHLSCWLDEELVQSAQTSDMVFTVSELVAAVSAVCTVEPGDLIFTGTPPGVGSGRKPPRFLREGQLLETEIEGIGRMRNRCVGAGR